MSIKGVVLAVVSALAGATLIAFGGYYAGRHRKNVQLQSEINSLSTNKKRLQEYNTKLVGRVLCLEKQNEDLNKKANVKKVNELEEECKQLNEQLNNEKQINTKNQEQIGVLEKEIKTLNDQMLILALEKQDCANKANIYEEVIRTMENNQYIQHSDD